MQESRIHSEGQNDHLISIKEKYNKLKNSLKRNVKLTEDKKQIELKKVEEQFNKEKKDSKQNLY
ncbi:hypothetical protein [Zobellia sp. 1_MG-2023]|jgi:hypothetical protein|uniref:hypothetical protein n=1 Tax=Zobellia sp. 1_MG-2023 TaxID=3062626 RepID=UPI0026E16942|nr:hypothetical protein [Zobellia sp. 1_MG-2023]MDO6821409.1 hypothetical protein [Zobellia sp. 1_MG-2023]